MTVAAADTLVWASDPEPFGSLLVFDFIAGQIFGAIGSEEAGGAAVDADAATATATGTAYNATISTTSQSDTPPTRLTNQRPVPRLAGGRTVVLTLTADLGSLTAHANTRQVFAEEDELLEIL